jgi:low affinity Fe/Cu permease
MANMNYFSKFSHLVARGAGQPITFGIACAGIVLWAATGPLFGFSQGWQLVVNTATTIITFLMVFVLQNTQYRDGEALQAKLDELILTGKAENRFIGAEKLSDHELHKLREIIDMEASQRRDKKVEAAHDDD